MDTSKTNLSRLQRMQSETTEFKREIGLFGGCSILAGIMVGSGIFYLGSYVLMRSGMSMGLALLVWLIGGIVTLFSGLCYAELGAMMPKAGGAYVYLREAYGKRVAFMSGFNGFVLGSSGSVAALAIALPTAVSNLIPLTDIQIKLIAVALIVGLTLVNYYGVKFGTWVQNIFMVAKIIPILVILFYGLTKGQQTPDLSLVPASGASVSDMLSMVAIGVVASLWAYEGWTNLNTVSEEIKNPKKNLPLALIISISFVTILYVVFNYAIYKVLPVDQISTLLEQGNYFLGTESAKTLLGNTGYLLVGIGMIVSIFGALNGCIMVFPRAYYAMAADGIFFKSFAKLHPKHKTPTGAIIASMIVSIVLVMMRNLDQLTSLVIFSGFIFNALTFYSVIIFRKKYPKLDRPYKVWGYPSIVIITILIIIGLTINTLIEDPVTSIIGLLVPLSGYVIYNLIEKRATNN